MTDAKRWTTREILDRPLLTGDRWVYDEDFDALVLVAEQLRDALRDAPCNCDHPLRAGLGPCGRCAALAAASGVLPNGGGVD